jgi:hypothetical protein
VVTTALPAINPPDIPGYGILRIATTLFAFLVLYNASQNAGADFFPALTLFALSLCTEFARPLSTGWLLFAVRVGGLLIALVLGLIGVAGSFFHAFYVQSIDARVFITVSPVHGDIADIVAFFAGGRSISLLYVLLGTFASLLLTAGDWCLSATREARAADRTVRLQRKPGLADKANRQDYS